MIDADTIDWRPAARRLAEIQADMIHREHTELCGDDFYAEALRRLFHRIGHGFVTEEEHMRVLEANRFVDRANGERAQATLREKTAEFERKLADARRVLADAIRRRVNERTVPSAYRREGVLLAADWLDGGATVTDGPGEDRTR
jgi:hypothetical protein